MEKLKEVVVTHFELIFSAINNLIFVSIASEIYKTILHQEF